MVMMGKQSNPVAVEAVKRTKSSYPVKASIFAGKLQLLTLTQQGLETPHASIPEQLK